MTKKQKTKAAGGTVAVLWTVDDRLGYSTPKLFCIEVRKTKLTYRLLNADPETQAAFRYRRTIPHALGHESAQAAVDHYIKNLEGAIEKHKLELEQATKQLKAARKIKSPEG